MKHSGWQFIDQWAKWENYSLKINTLHFRKNDLNAPQNGSLTYCNFKNKQEENSYNYHTIKHLEAPTASRVPSMNRWIETGTHKRKRKQRTLFQSTLPE